jgi:hypothetical protein
MNPVELEAKALLWIAHWGVACPDIPAPFKSWPFWQYAAMSDVPGITTMNVDLDRFDGTLDELHALGVTNAPSPSAASAGGASLPASGAGGDGGKSAFAAANGSGGAGGALVNSSAEDASGTEAVGMNGACDVSVHGAPSQKYAAIWNLLLALALWVAPRRRHAARSKAMAVLSDTLLLGED